VLLALDERQKGFHMKFKAAITDNAPDRLMGKLNDREIASLLMERVVVKCLHVDKAELGPATHYVQRTDKLVALSNDIGVVVGLTMVSKKRTRSHQDFADALQAIEAVYETIIAAEMPRGTKAQLFVAIALDGDVEAPVHMGGKRTNLIETEPKWIDGTAEL
jgi:hypothetical protein